MSDPRGTTAARGYGSAHQQLRTEWEPKVQAGAVSCWRCKRLIAPGSPWHLGHDDDDRARYRGPEHRTCNVGAAAKQRKRAPRRRDERAHPGSLSVTDRGRVAGPLGGTPPPRGAP